ncbi:hypothetical protein Acr_00g0028070 [Actinidia rufa]|uniref:Uncharacterized protein n=1 Tax=Actinidia rufa TaxID=165716 RepID=A0A7J0DES2_9ERIC|nr:hypothetical protein Acr_00g0028070 [Actinidia rufa]
MLVQNLDAEKISVGTIIVEDESMTSRHLKHCASEGKIPMMHGGGQVFKSLQRLVPNLDGEKISVGTIIAEDESMTSRHLKHCASEGKIPMMPASWIINSLHAGKRFLSWRTSITLLCPQSRFWSFPSSMAPSQEM